MKILRSLLQLKRSSVDNEIDIFKEYLSDVNRLANQKLEKLDDAVKEIVRKRPEEEQGIYDHFLEDFEKYDSKYIQIANNGSLVNSYSFFEQQLKEIASLLNKFVVNKKTSLNPKKDKYALNLRNAIFAISGLDFSSLNTQWIILDKYRDIRNIIVHNGSNLKEVDEEEEEIIKLKNYPLVSSFSQIKINEETLDFYIDDKELVENYIDLVGEYLKNILDILKQLDDSDIV